jgi:alpha-tubulin suppressor-like RCC1 family protein
MTAVKSGTDHVVTLSSAGEAWTWGCGEGGRLGRLEEVDADYTGVDDKV